MHGVDRFHGDVLQKMAHSPGIVPFLPGVQDHKGGVDFSALQFFTEEPDLFPVINRHLRVVVIGLLLPDPVVQVSRVVEKRILVFLEEGYAKIGGTQGGEGLPGAQNIALSRGYRQRVHIARGFYVL